MLHWMSDAVQRFRRFYLPGTLLTLAEMLAIWIPLSAFFELTQAEWQALRAVGPPALACAWAIWTVLMRKWRAPIVAAIADHDRGRSFDPEPAYRAILGIPRRAVALRVGLWFGLAALTGGVMHLQAGFPIQSVWTLTSIIVVHAFGVSIFRALWYARSLGKLSRVLWPDLAPLRRFADNYHNQLVLAAVATGALGVFAIAIFIYFFIPINREQYRALATYFPLTIIALCGAWWPYVKRVPRPIDRYLEAELSSDPSKRPTADDPRAAEAYRTGQLVPYKFALAKAGFWLVGELLLVLQSVLVFSIDRENAALMGGEAAVVTIGATLYEALWNRSTMRPLLNHLSTRHRHSPSLTRTPLRLRSKMLTNFGALTVFACGLALFWSYMQYKVLATGFIQRESELRLHAVLGELQTRATQVPTGSLSAEEIASVLRENVSQFVPPKSVQAEAVFYFLPLDPAEEAIAVGSGSDRPPRLPEIQGKEPMRRRAQGELELSDLHLTGSYARLIVSGGELGSIAVLLPGYRGRGPSTVPQIQVLLCFFFILFFASMGIVFLAANDIIRPIHELERHAAKMAAGDLSLPVSTSGDADEIGQLNYTFEEMRRALNAKLRSSEEMNEFLEQEVRRRTAELERRNREIADALRELERAQDQLVHSEKMASMGRLVAGIAHEINNPVNAVVNSIGPLEDSLAQLPFAESGGQLTEVREILRVIQGGARRTKEIVQALHNYSRGDDDRVVEVDLQRGIDESLDLLRHQLKGGIRVEKHYHGGTKVRGRTGQLNQVFLNLLTNAAQALGDRGTIQIDTETKGGKLTVHVSDDGPGIPPEILPRIFDPFFTTKEVGQGSGLGLSIVHGIVERHGGTIEVKSEVGKGTRFSVTLPQA